ncbi:MAG: copper resistance protein NlpE [Tannerellaceae bacterium]|nr:copper resistance protein NlpE [Tannerellaceae bacterium]
MKYLVMIACCAWICGSCTQNTHTNRTGNQADSLTISAPDTHTAENSLDYWGTYHGTVPSASGSGIETTLTLRKDKTYTLKTVYIDREEGNTFDEKGDYTIDGNIITLHNLSDGNMYYQIQEDQIVQLDRERKPITGSLAKDYILKKK